MALPQLKPAHMEVPAGQKWPPGQGRHEVEPGREDEEKVPFGQIVQEEAPAAEKEPAGHKTASMEERGQ